MQKPVLVMARPSVEFESGVTLRPPLAEAKGDPGIVARVEALRDRDQFQE